MSEPVTPAAPAREDRGVHIHPEIVDSLVDAWCAGEVWSPGWRKNVYDKSGTTVGATAPQNVDAQGLPPDGVASRTDGDVVPSPPPPKQVAADKIREALLRYQAILKADEPDTGTPPLIVAWDGARIENVTITGCLDLRYIKFDRSIQFRTCIFKLPILFDNAEVGAIDLSESQFPLFSGNSIVINGNLRLSKVRAFAISVQSSTINGRIDINESYLFGDIKEQWGDYIGFGGKNLSRAGRESLANTHNVTVAQAADGSESDPKRAPEFVLLDSLAGPLSNLAAQVDQDTIVVSRRALARRMRKLKWHSTPSAINHFLDELQEWVTKTSKAFPNKPELDFESLSKWLIGRDALQGMLRVPLNADGSTIRGSLFLNKTVAFGTVSIIMAHIYGQVSCVHSKLIKIHGCAMIISQTVIGDSIFLGSPDVLVGGFLAIGSLNFNSAQIGHIFRLGPAASVEHLNLTWAKADVFDIALDSTPHAGCLTVDGFVYQRLASSSYGAKYGLRLLRHQHKRAVGWDLHPQPFLQLASVLSSTGHPGEARSVLLDLADRKLFGRDFVRWFFSPLWLASRLVQVMAPRAIWGMLKRVALWFEIRDGRTRGVVRYIREIDARLQKHFDMAEADQPDVPLLGFLYLPMRIILWATAGHGYRPFRTVPWLVGLWLAGAVIFGAAQERGMIVPSAPPQPSASSSPIGAYPVRPLNRRARFDPGVYSLEVLIPFVDLGQAKYWSPVPAGDLPVAAPAPKAAPKRLTLVQSVVGAASQVSPGAIAQWPAKARGLLDQWLDSGFAANWRWMEALIGWFLATITIGGYTGLVRPLEGPHG